ncbi:MAG: GNAT family N-acetyltransferase [Gammaproteobacteria bacterium]|nr:GNAT family N-acetyltransferase [Gammaproteobacteria bacterium]
MYQSSTTIEFASVADAEEIGELSRDYIEYDLGWDYTPDKITRLIKTKNKNVIVAREDSRLVGFGIMTYYDTQANLDLLAVKLRHRYQGTGRRLVQWLEKVALTAGIVTIYIQVRETNTGAIKFYEKLDYKIIDKRPGYYRGQEAAVIMAKNLRKQVNQ